MLKRLAAWLLEREIRDLNRQIHWLTEENNTLSSRKDPKHSTGVLTKEVYRVKVLQPLSNPILSSTSSVHEVAFKLGVQYALRHVEKEVVVE